MTDPERRKKIEVLCKEGKCDLEKYCNTKKKDLNELWNENYQIVLKYTKDNGKLPTMSDKVNNGNWINKQKEGYKHYKNNTNKIRQMKDNKRREKIEIICKEGKFDLEKYCNKTKKQTI